MKDKKSQEWGFSIKKLPDAVIVPDNPTKECLKVCNDAM